MMTFEGAALSACGQILQTQAICRGIFYSLTKIHEYGKKFKYQNWRPPQKCQMEKKILTPFKFLSDTFRTLPVKKYTSPPKPG